MPILAAMVSVMFLYVIGYRCALRSLDTDVRRVRGKRARTIAHK